MDNHEKSRFDSDGGLDQALEAAKIVESENSDLLRTLADAVRRTKAAIWAEENASAIAARRTWIEDEGTPLSDAQALDVHRDEHRD